MGIADRIGKWWRGLRDDEWQALTALRSLGKLLGTAPELALAMLDLLPSIINEIKRLERALPESGKGRAKLADFVAWLEHEHGDMLRKYASVSDIYQTARAIASLLVAVMNATGMFRRGA